MTREQGPSPEEAGAEKPREIANIGGREFVIGSKVAVERNNGSVEHDWTLIAALGDMVYVTQGEGETLKTKPLRSAEFLAWQDKYAQE